MLELICLLATSDKFYKMGLLQIRFCKQILGSSFFGDAVDIDIHEEPKNELTTNLAAKGRICNSPKIHPLDNKLQLYQGLKLTKKANTTRPYRKSNQH